MTGLREAAFLLGYGLLATHELDAVLRAEWRVLPGLAVLDEAIARPLFIALHVPLFALLTAWVGSRNTAIRQRARYAISLFLVVHAGLHLLFSGHRHYDFAHTDSEVYIFGGAAAGLLWLATIRASAAMTPR